MRHMLRLEDSTGETIVTFYQKAETTLPPPLRNFEYVEGSGQWVRIYGFIRVFHDQKSIVGINLQEITKHDEITNHFLKVFVAHNVRHKGVLDAKDTNSAMPAKSNTGVSGQNKNQTVLNLMKEICRTSKFAHKNDLWTMCQRQMTNEEFVNALQGL